MELYIEHHGILGQKWGVRRYQNPDGSLTPAGRKHLEKEDMKWARKNEQKIYSYAYKQSAQALNEHIDSLDKTNMRNSDGKINANFANQVNKKYSQLMSEAVSDLRSPSGKTVKFVSQRGKIGVYLALADEGYDMSQVKNGVYNSGKVAYRKNTIDMK